MIAKLESFVRRLTEDESFRQSALRNPERAVSQFGLAGPERQGALQLCAAVAAPNSAIVGPLGLWW
jgi:hypothetical protein